MKILVAGSWNWSQNEEAFGKSLEIIGHDVVKFSFDRYFDGIAGHYQEAFPVPGPALLRMNREFINEVQSNRPDIVLVWRGTHLLPRTLKKSKTFGPLVVSYNNDDPFGPAAHGNVPWHHRFLWLWYLRGLGEYDANFFYRSVNLDEAIAHGARNALLLMPYFTPRWHRPVELSDEEKKRFECDAVFIGHYEPDGREELLRGLVRAGLHVRLFGGEYWTRSVLGELTSHFGKVLPVFGDDYTKALCGAKLCLAFLSRLNRDSYTRRCFEIPACGRLLLCERTEDLRNLFLEGEEAVFFSSKEELVEKALWLMSHPEEIERIAAAGRKRVHADGHDAVSRAKQFIHQITEIRARKDDLF